MWLTQWHLRDWEWTFVIQGTKVKSEIKLMGQMMH